MDCAYVVSPAIISAMEEVRHDCHNAAHLGPGGCRQLPVVG